MIPAVERAAKKRSKMNHFQFPLDQKTIRRWIGLSASDSGGSNHVQPRLVSIRSLSQIRHSAVAHADHVTTKPSSSSHQHVLYILRCNDIMLFTVYEDGPWWWAWYALCPPFYTSFNDSYRATSNILLSTAYILDLFVSVPAMCKKFLQFLI